MNWLKRQAGGISEAEDSTDALGWLSSNKNKFAFASNYFRETSNATRMIHDLMSQGCTQIMIGEILGDRARIKSEGGPYAATLYVTLPTSPEERSDPASMLDYIEESYHPDEINPVLGKPNRFRLWWD